MAVQEYGSSDDTASEDSGGRGSWDNPIGIFVKHCIIVLKIMVRIFELISLQLNPR